MQFNDILSTGVEFCQETTVSSHDCNSNDPFSGNTVCIYCMKVNIVKNTSVTARTIKLRSKRQESLPKKNMHVTNYSSCVTKQFERSPKQAKLCDRILDIYFTAVDHQCGPGAKLWACPLKWEYLHDPKMYHSNKKNSLLPRLFRFLHSKVVLCKVTQGSFFLLPISAMCMLITGPEAASKLLAPDPCMCWPASSNQIFDKHTDKFFYLNLSKKSPKCAFSSSGQDSYIVHTTH